MFLLRTFRGVADVIAFLGAAALLWPIVRLSRTE
jgi:hypothetical protein